MNVLGLMSGNSCDGLDCCDINIDINSDYKFNFRINKFSSIPYTNEEKSFILSLRENKKYMKKNYVVELTNIFLDKIKLFSSKTNYEIIACHGQTVSHIDKVSSVQLLDPRLLFKEFKIPIIYNFRKNDVKHGGSGAPLMPFLDWLLFSNLNENTLTLNIGGISNITFIPINGGRNKIIGFDTGPGMCLIDRATDLFFNKSYDKDAFFSKEGKVNESLLNMLMLNPFIYMKPPKSTDIKQFNDKIFRKIIDTSFQINKNNLIRTLVQFTIDSITYNISNFINFSNKQINIIYSGGGTDHPLIIKGLMKKGFNCTSISKYGIDSSIKEAMLIALLGVCRVNNIKSNMTSVTGATNYSLLGDIYNA